MVSLSSQARLLAAQAFNKQVLEQKARDRQAEIERERREDLLRTTRRLEAQKASARNVVEARRIQDAINERLRSKAEVDRRARINAEAKRKTANVFTRVSKGANIGVLTGFEAKRDSRGRAVGISKKISKTRKRTITLLRTEIARQQKIAREGTDLERFLRNEQAINQGRVSRSELNKQIASRKRRGLSKTPAQKRASQGFRDQEFSSALSSRATRKGRPDIRATFGQAVSERARASGLGSRPFADPLFTFGGRTRAEQVARGGTFGRRAGGQSISNQLSFISQAKSRSTSARIGFAQGLLSNLGFEGSSQSSLLSIVGNKRIKTPKTFQQELRSGVGFFTTEAIPVTRAKLTKGARGQLVARRKAEDFAKAEKARKTIARQGRATTQNIFDLDALGASLDVSNLARGRAIEAQNLARPPRFSLAFGVSVQRQQAQDPTGISLIPTRSAFVGATERVAKGQTLTPSQKRAQAEATQRETQLLRDTPFVSGGLVQATGIRGTSTETFFPSVPIDDGQAFNVNLRENIGISDIFGVGVTPAPAPRTKKGKKGRTSRAPTPRDQFDVLNPAGLIAPAPRTTRAPTATPRPSDPFADIFGGVGEALGGVGEAFGGVGEAVGGISEGFGNFFAIGREAGGSDLLREAGSLENLFGAGSSLASGDFFSQFNVDPDFDPAEVGRIQGLRI